MDGVEENHRSRGLEYARSLEFTDNQYEEALKLVDCPSNLNQLLVALVIVSGPNNDNSDNINNSYADVQSDTNNPDRGQLLSSGYSSMSEFPLNSSLEDQTFDQAGSSRLDILKKIYIDGSNVARTHSKDGSFSWLGIKLCVDWFLARHHPVKVFVPEDKCILADRPIIDHLKDVLIETPTGCNDDIFILKAAKYNNGIIVSNDKFREETTLPLDLKSCVHFNRLPYIFVDDLFIPAQDPRGRSGPTLEEFLRTPSLEKPRSSYRKDRTTNHPSTKSLDMSRYRNRRCGFVKRFNPDSKQRNNNNHTNSNRNPASLHESVDLIQFHSEQAIADCKSTNEHHPEQSTETQNNSKQYHQQVRKAISLAQTHSDYRAQNNQTTASLGVGRKSALCRAKSHNI